MLDDDDDEPAPDRGPARRFRYEEEDDDEGDEGGEGGEGGEGEAFTLGGRRATAGAPAARAEEAAERRKKAPQPHAQPPKKGPRKPLRRAPSSTLGGNEKDSEKAPLGRPLGAGDSGAARAIASASVQMTSIHAPSADDLD